MIVSIPLRYDRMSALVAVSDDPGSLSRTRDPDRARARFFIKILAPVIGYTSRTRSETMRRISCPARRRTVYVV